MVLLPGPQFPALNGPPSAWALSMRPWLLASFAALLPVAVARCVVCDLIGGLFLFMTAGLGWYAVMSGMDMMWLVCLALVLFLNATFDAAILLSRMSGTEAPMFGPELSYGANVVHALLCSGPPIELVGACMCWRVYRDQMSHVFPGLDEQLEGVDRRGDEAIALLAAGAESRVTRRAGHDSAVAHESREVVPFQGIGHRLS
uniref:Uncharacterized protein n=1 Tax=Alexandrium catenella TaxID=2925 RepID=A0A7S1RDW4_ALECA|mmetsp:Transcript_5459/g.14487  ORF Transcript_5459/g.14487 Transcript_5459/m.14487 type:complete len:202 (+) Transcript_5459:120-725(+)